MQNTNYKEVSTPLTWNLNEFGQPTDKQSRTNYLHTMGDLARNLYKLDRLEINRIQQIGSNLFMPKNPTSINSKNIQTVRAILLKKHPECFPYALSFQMGGIVQIIEKYEFFKKPHYRIPEIIIPLPISMEPEDDKDIIINYLNYIRTDSININNVNVHPIYLLAKQQNDQFLKKSCLNFVMKNYNSKKNFFSKHIDFDILIDLLDFSILKNLKDLQWLCLIFAFNNRNHTELIEILEDESLSEEGKFILQLGQYCAEFSFTPYFKELGDYPHNTYERALEIQSISPEHINSQVNLFADIYNYLNIGRLDFHYQNDKDLFESLMTPFLNDSVIPLNYLSYVYNKFENVSEVLFSSVKNLFLKGDGPKILTLPNTLYFLCEESETVTYIECSMAKRIKCHHCSNLETLKIEQAKEVDIKKCLKLKLLIVKRGCRILNRKNLPKKCVIQYVD